MNGRPIRQLWLPFVEAEDDLFHANPTSGHPTNNVQILEQALERDNMFQALARVEHNGGSPGVDGMTVKELGGYSETDTPWKFRCPGQGIRDMELTITDWNDTCVLQFRFEVELLCE